MGVLRDARVVIRSLLKSPSYAIAAVLTLGLAIGANTAIFSAVYGVLLKPLPIRDPDRLVVAWKTEPARNLPVVEATFRDYERWRMANRSFVQMAAIGSSLWPAVLEQESGAVKVASAGVTATFFDTLGAKPVIGRALQPQDDQPDARPVAVLSYGFWTSHFGADSSVVGSTMRMSSGPVEIVGVMPEGFDFPRGTSFWKSVVPVLAGSGKTWGSDAFEHTGVLFVLGRLRDGATVESAGQEIDVLARHAPNALQRPIGIPAARAVSFQQHYLGPVQGAMWWLLAAVGALLVVACANVSGLMLTRAALRQREQAIRLALGATAAAVGRLWLLESALVAAVGGGLGMAVASWMMDAIGALAPADVPGLSDISLNVPVALFTFASVALTALLCGLGPILGLRTKGPLAALNDSSRGSTGSSVLRARSALVTLQIALAVALLISAGLIVRSVASLQRLDLGFDPTGVVGMNIQPRIDKPSPNQAIHDLLGRIAHLPGVKAAGAVYLRPLALGAIGQETWVVLEGQSDTQSARDGNPALNYQVATPGYFGAMQIPLLRGRHFDDRDHARSPRVAVLGESAANRLFPGRDPVGQRIAMPSFTPKDDTTVWRTVVGVVSDVRYRGLNDVRLDVYDAALQASQTAGFVVARTDGDPVTLAAAVQTEARQQVRGVVDGVTTMDAVVERAMAPWRFSMWTFSLFAALAFLLAAVGLVGVVSLDVVHRSREFAIRLALGASRSDIQTRVLRSAGRRLLAGTTAGLLVAVVVGRWLGSLLFDVDRLDTVTYGIVVALVAFVVTAAAYVPARRAAGTEPAALFRSE
jgi:predicted permease